MLRITRNFVQRNAEVSVSSRNVAGFIFKSPEVLFASSRVLSLVSARTPSSALRGVSLPREGHDDGLQQHAAARSQTGVSSSGLWSLKYHQHLFITITSTYVGPFETFLLVSSQFHLWAHSEGEDRGVWADALEGVQRLHHPQLRWSWGVSGKSWYGRFPTAGRQAPGAWLHFPKLHCVSSLKDCSCRLIATAAVSRARPD